MSVVKRSSFRCLLSFLLAALLLGTSLPAKAENVTYAYHTMVENLPVTVDGGGELIIKTLHYSYRNNRYVSLRDMAEALKATPKRFNVSLSGDGIFLSPGSDYVPAGGEGLPFPESDPSSSSPYVYTTRTLALNPMEIAGSAVRYLTFLGTSPAGAPDCFMSLTDLAMVLDLDVKLTGGVMQIDSAGFFDIDLPAIEQEGFYHEVHAALVGDATTGTIYAAWEPDLSVPVASTSKLMTFLCVMDAIADGTISMEDTVVVPPEAAALSRTMDGMITLEAGWETNIPDLLCAMLLPSSNESALALAIHTAGSESAFVSLMNRKARALGLSDGAVFYNCNGLPMYSDNLAATKIQNRMSARDMFTLVTHILRTYPDITRITSLKGTELQSLHTYAANTNPLLYNIPGVVGLKTGTTNMSGICLVCALRAEDPQGAPHMLVAMEFGAEDASVRTTFTEELLFYGLRCLREGIGAEPDAVTEIPRDAEGLIRLILQNG